MLGKKLCFIFILISMLSACVVRPVHHVKKVRVKAPEKTLVRVTSANAKTNVIVVEPLLVSKQHCRVVNVHNICRH